MDAKQRPRGLVITSLAEDGMKHRQIFRVSGSEALTTPGRRQTPHLAFGPVQAREIVMAWLMLTYLFSLPPAKPAKQF